MPQGGGLPQARRTSLACIVVLEGVLMLLARREKMSVRAAELCTVAGRGELAARCWVLARDQARGLAIGANAFLSKPFSADALRALVAELRTKVGS